MKRINLDEKWYSVNLKRILILLCKIIGTFIAICIFFLLVYGVIKPLIMQTISGFQKETVFRNNQPEEWRVRKAAYEKAWDSKTAQYTPQYLISHMQEAEFTQTKCNYSGIYLNNNWRTAFRYPLGYTTTDDDSSTQVWVSKNDRELMRIYPSVETGEIGQVNAHTIEEYMGRWKTNIYGNYYDELTRITLGNKIIYRLRSISLDNTANGIIEGEPTYRYMEFVDSHCSGFIRYANVGIPENDFFCIADTVKLLCN